MRACVSSKEGRIRHIVSFEYTEGMWRGKCVVPKNDYFNFRELELEFYSEKQVLPILRNILKKEGVRTPYIVNVNIEVDN